MKGRVPLPVARDDEVLGFSVLSRMRADIDTEHIPESK